MDLIGSLVSAVLQVIFDRLATREFWELFMESEQDQRPLKKLERNLRAVEVVLDDAETKQTRIPAVKNWLDGLQDAAYRAEDLVDEINTEALRVKVEAQYSTVSASSSTCSPNLVKGCFKPFMVCGRLSQQGNLSNKFLKEIMPKVEEINEILEDFVKKIGVLGLEKRELENRASRDPSTSLVDDADVYGRDADKEKIIQILLDDDEENGRDIGVIPIFGLGGIGKTTLAQWVYNDNKVKSPFDTKAWVCISEEYDAKRITKELLGQLNIAFNSDDSLDSLQVKLLQGLTDKKFLLVLDDVWNRSYDDWLKLKNPFKVGRGGSKIIVTTRDESIALMMRNGPMLNLNIMSEEDCWLLFKRHALEHRDSAKLLELELVGKDIVRKCKGLPLAVKTIAGLLRSKETVEEWNEILGSDVWDQPQDQNNIYPALRLSYNHLPSYLKRCFAYCAVFHKDYHFSQEEVIFFWIANDLLPGDSSRFWFRGDEYFRELRLRSFFQQLHGEKFAMHDLINDLAKIVAGNYFVRQEDKEWKSKLLGARHFSYLNEEQNVTFQKFKSLNEARCLRTFLPISVSPFSLRFSKNLCSKKLLHDVLPTFRSLRTLSLCGYDIAELPDSLGELKQLRFLNLSFTLIRKLPGWICGFYNLQILLLAYCEYLKDLPADMEKLVNLCHLDLTGVPLIKMPMQISKLENLQFLSTFAVSKDRGRGIEELGSFCNLRGQLTILGLENIESARDALMAKIKGKKLIKDLALKWREDTDDSLVARDILDNLQPHSTVDNLTIVGYCGTQFPDWLGDPSFSHLVSLRLSNCNQLLRLPALGQLPSLKSLKICEMNKISALREEIYGDGLITKPFPSLEVLRIERMQELKDWYIPNKYSGAFSNLEKLYVINCPHLVGELPKQLSSLRKFKIFGCPKLINLDGHLNIFESQVNLSPSFSSLRKLQISNMPTLKELPSEDLYKVTGLEELTIRNCPSLASLYLDALPKLKYLWIANCGNLEFQSCETSGSNHHVSIETLIIHDSCHSLIDLYLGMFPQLRNVLIQCVNVLSITLGSQYLTSLRSLDIEECKKLKSLPKWMHTLLPSLTYLSISDCPEIECIPVGGFPSSLELLTIGSNCKKLVRRRRGWGLQSLERLKNLEIWVGTDEVVEPSFPEEWLLPRSLTDLRLRNLKMLNYRELQHLTSLETLKIRNCPELQSLPEEGLPAFLKTLYISICPKLQSLPKRDCLALS